MPYEVLCSFTVICALPSTPHAPLNVLWCSPGLGAHPQFRGIKVGADLGDYFDGAEAYALMQHHVLEQDYVQSAYQIHMEETMWGLDVSRREELVLGISELRHTLSNKLEETLGRVNAERDMGQQILDLLPNPVFVKDRAHRWILGNQAFWDLIGKNVLGCSDYDIFSKEQADVFWQKDEEVFVRRLAVGNEEEITPTDGSTRWLWTVKTPLELSDGSIGLVGVITDITRRKLAEEQLIQNVVLRDEALEMSRSKSQFLASMSHELRTPLNAILGYTELLLDESEEIDDELFAPDLKKIHKATYHLLGLISDVLDLSRVETGVLTCEASQFELEVLIAECFELLEHSVKSSQSLTFLMSEQVLGPIRLELDRTKLKQVLLNIIGNAIKFSQRGTITVHLEESDAMGIRLTVTDEGRGVHEDDHDKIFRPFERLEYEASGILGTGLGLGLSRYICRAMGGDLDIVASPHDSHSTSFVIRLPHVMPDTRSIQNHARFEHLAQSINDLHDQSRHDVIVLSPSSGALHELLHTFSATLPIHLIRSTSPLHVLTLSEHQTPTCVIVDHEHQRDVELPNMIQELCLAHEPVPRIFFYGRDAPRRKKALPPALAAHISLLPHPLTYMEWGSLIDRGVKDDGNQKRAPQKET